MENRSAAGLRRSAIAERLRLREEWQALKGVNEEPKKNTHKNVLTNRQQNIHHKKIVKGTMTRSRLVADKENSQITAASSDILHGVVVLVDVGSESRALALRAALSALGATVVPAWSPLVTHLVWSQGGCRDTRARARALACRVVSPLWVEACAGATRMLPEGVFPAPSRPSDLPSPTTLKRLLIKADRSNVPFANLLSESQGEAPKRLRISSETEQDTSHSTNTSQDTSHDTSRDKSKDKTCETPGDEVRVNTAPRRALPLSTSPERPTRSRRKLFTNREPDTTDAESEEDPTPAPKRAAAMSARERRELVQAERMARRLVSSLLAPLAPRTRDTALRVVLTGMSRTERHIIRKAIKHLNGKVQSKVDKRTDCVVLGSCTNQCPEDLLSDLTSKLNIDKENLTSTQHQTDMSRQVQAVNMSGVCRFDNTKPSNLTRVKKDKSNLTRISECTESDIHPNRSTFKDNSTSNINIRSNLTQIGEAVENNTATNAISTNVTQVNINTSGINDIGSVWTQVRSGMSGVSPEKPRTVNALLGAVRGCRVLHANWVVDSIRQNRWLHHIGYEVKHLMKISQKARVERSALGLMKSEYAYNVFRGMRVRLSPDADQGEGVSQLLSMCGAHVIQNNGARTQNGGASTQIRGTRALDGAERTGNGGQDGGTLTQNGCQDADITIGVKNGEVSSKWVFDSITASRMRTTRRYINT